MFNTDPEFAFDTLTITTEFLGLVFGVTDLRINTKSLKPEICFCPNLNENFASSSNENHI